MFTDVELANLVDMAGVYRMESGWQVTIRADWVDVTEQQPLGLDYALILQNERGERIFGFDNTHAYDGAAAQAPWDHEHRANYAGQHFRYDFVSPGQLISDFFEKLEAYCTAHGVSSDFIAEDTHD